MATGYRLADQRIVLGSKRPPDATRAVQISADPKYLVAQSWDETIAVAVLEMAIKNFPLRTTTEVIRHANVVGPVTVDGASMSGLTLLHGHQDGREQMNLLILVKYPDGIEDANY